jgi:hypothetical protein
LPPSPLQAHLFTDTRFGLADPIRIGPEAQIQAGNEAMKFAAENLQDLSPQQKAIALGQMQAMNQKAINEEIYRDNVVNAQNLASTELFNIGQRDKQSLEDRNNKLNFEQRQYLAMANTEEDFRRYFDRLNDIDMNEFLVNQNLNMINQLSDDFDLARNMSQVEYNPDGTFRIRTNPYSQLFGNPYV